MSQDQMRNVEDSATLPDLTNSALDAAMQLDSLIQDQAGDRSALMAFSEKLKNLSSLGQPEGELTLQCSPYTLDVLSRTLIGVEEKAPGTISDLTTRIEEYAKLLTGELVGDQRNLERLRAFCVSLHRELVSFVAQADHSDPFQETWAA